MRWLTSRTIAKLIADNKLNDIQRLLEAYSPEERQHILSEKVKGSSLLYIAVQYNHLAIVSYFLDTCGANPNDTGHMMGMESPCLWKAACLNSMSVVHCLLEHGADIEGVNCYETTALFISCQYGYHNMVQFLLKRRANVNSTDHEGVTCLMAAVAHPEICRYLLAAGASVNQGTAPHGETALMMAIEDMQIRTVSILLCGGADPTITNDRGENAVFTAALKSLKIRSEYLHRNPEMVTNCVARALEIASCHKTVSGNRSLAVRFWKGALKLRNLPSKTPIYPSVRLSSPSELPSILGLFDDKVAEALVFLESKLGLCHLYSLNLLKGLIFNVESLDGCVTFFNFFIRLISSTRNDVFFKMHSHLYDMTALFFLKMSFGSDRWCAILKSLVAHLKNLSNRFHRMDNISRLAKTKQMNIYYQIILNIVNVFVQKHPSRIQHIYKDISNLVKLDVRTIKDMSLLHFCIESRYSTRILSILLSCGANVNARDYEGTTPIHYALGSFKYCTREIIGWFFKHGLRLDENTEDNHCLPCLLKRKKLLDQQSKYINLQCLAARAVAQVGVAQKMPVARTIQILIHSHS